MLKKICNLLAALCALCLLAGCAGAAVEPSVAPPDTTAAPVETAVEAELPTETEAPAEETEPAAEPFVPALPDGVYTAVFDTDSSMFHVNESLDSKGILTVQDGVMTIHVSLASKGILNLFPGTAEDAQKEGAVLLEPSTDEVTYSDGTTEEVYGFDIPVPYLDEAFDCALVGKKGTWYDHKVSVSEPRRVAPEIEQCGTIELTMTGGSGRAKIESPAPLVQAEDGTMWAVLVWSSPNYLYMLVDGVQYDCIQTEGNSTFLIPIVLDADMNVSGLTVAMSEPHLVDYVLHFDSASIAE